LNLRMLLATLVLPACVVQTGIDDPEPVAPAPPAVRVDADDDGFTEAEGDCDDSDPRVGPALAFTETCDLLDNDCDGEVDNLGVCTVRDRFEQSLQLDVLLVVDTTEGMDPYLRRAGDAAYDFAQHLLGPGYDTRLGVITMAIDEEEAESTTFGTKGSGKPYDGVQNGELVSVGGARWLDGSTTSLDQAEGWLRRALADHEPHSGPPRARDAVVAHLGPGGEDGNNTFFRAATPLVVMFLSREEDQSAMGVAAFLDEVDDRFALAPTMHAIARLDDGPCEGDVQGSFGASYVTLADQSNGVTLDVCTDPYEPFFFVTGQLAADDGLGKHYPLDHQANLARPILVQVVGPAGFVEVLEHDAYDVVDEGHTLVLQVPPTAGSEVLIDYHRLPPVE